MKNYAIKNEIVLDRIILSYRVNLYFLEKAIIVRLIQVNANNIVFTLKIRLAILIFHAIFFISVRSFFFFTICVFLQIVKYILDITKDIKNMSISEIKGFIFENYYKRIGFSKIIGYNSVKRLYWKDLLLLANKLLKNVTNPRNAKEHY